MLFRCVLPGIIGSDDDAMAVRPRDGFYLRNNLWMADARTFVSLVHYLFQPDPPTLVTTNVVNG